MVSQSSGKHEVDGRPAGGAGPDRGGVVSNSAGEAILNGAFLLK